METTGVVTNPETQPVDAPASDVTVRWPRWMTALGGWLASPVNLYAALLALIPLGLVVLFVLDRGNNMPYLDQWVNSTLIAVKTANGTLTLDDIVRQNFDHRLVFANLITMVLTWTTHWNLVVEMFLVVAVSAVNVVLLATLFALHNARALAAVVVPFSLLVFAVRANSIWLWSMLISTPLIIMFLLLALILLKRSPPGWKPLFGAAACALCMSLCLLQGFIAWPLLLVALWLFGYRKPAYFGVWVAVAVVVSALYFSNYDFSLLGADEEGNSAGLVLSLSKLVGYSLAYLGNPFALPRGGWHVASMAIAVVGLVLVAANTVFLWRRSRSLADVTAWLVLALWACGSALLTAFGRGHVYPELLPQQPMIDRYVPPPSMFWAALIALAVLVLWRFARGDRSPVSRVLMLLNVVLLAVLTPLYAYVNLSALSHSPPISDQNVECMLRFPASRNTRCFARTYLKQTPLIEVVDRINELQRYQLAAFAGHEPVYVDSVALYRVDRVTDIGSDVGFKFYDVGSSRSFIALQQPAPARSVFTVPVPDTDHPVYFGGAVTLEPADGSTNGAVMFRIGVRSDLQGDRLLGEILYDPQADRGLKSFRVNLDLYRGEQVSIILQAASVADVPVNTPIWIDPQVYVTPS